MQYAEAVELLARQGRASMTITRLNGHVTVRCDHCHASFETDDADEAERRLQRHVREVCPTTAGRHIDREPATA